MNATQFKSGDRIRAVETVPGYITKGIEYVVKAVDGDNIVIEGQYHNGKTPALGLNATRFELAPVQFSPFAGSGLTSEPMILPSDPVVRKGMPITTGVLDYFPLALAEVAKVSKSGNDQHNPGQPLHWAKEKSTDHADCIPRHLIDRGRRDSDGMRHSAKLAWRALALLQTELEAEAKA